MNVAHKIHQKYEHLSNVIWRYHLTNPAMEIVYRALFLRELGRLGLEDEYYPVGSAANHSLLYLITRCFAELDITTVLDLGCGQSSILLSRLNARLDRHAHIHTVEHDPAWASYIQARVDHDILVAPLVDREINGYKLRHYGGAYFDTARRYNLVLIDGPPAYSNDIVMSRLGALDVVTQALDKDFVIIIDDAERRGEEVLVRLIRRALKDNDVPFAEGAVMAQGRQHVFAGGAFSHAAYF